MKNTYITPALNVTKVNAECMIAASGDQTFTVSNVEVTDGYADVKGSRNDYNVWSDDWSK